MKKIVSILILLFVSACSLVGNVRTFGKYQSTTVEAPNDIYSLVNADYVSLDEQKRKEDKSANLELRQSDYSNLYKNGYMSLQVFTKTIGAANPMYWTVVIVDQSGEELARSKFKGQIPFWHYSRWSSVLIVPLKKPHSGKFKVYASNRILGYRWAFDVEKKIGK